MKCISLIQPWATLLLSGAKRYETRSWKTHYRGPLAIHASGRFPIAARGLCNKEPFKSALLAAGFRCGTELPIGKLLGTVVLADCLRVEDVAPMLAHPELSFGDYSPGRWAWELRAPTPLVSPVVLKGKLGLYEIDLPASLVDRMEAAHVQA
jgi:activating signal cointegrator 1